MYKKRLFPDFVFFIFFNHLFKIYVFMNTYIYIAIPFTTTTSHLYNYNQDSFLSSEINFLNMIMLIVNTYFFI